MNSPYKIVIPARYESSRLPGKPLLDVAGKPLIERVWACAMGASAAEVVIATDDARIESAAIEFGASAVRTRADHASGSDRIAECIDSLGWNDETLVVNLQGDEPLMPAECLDQVANLLDEDDHAVAASLYQRIDDPEDVENPNVVKVVTDLNGRAVYFSRAAIPFYRRLDHSTQPMAWRDKWKRHIGLYAYRAGALRAMTKRRQGPLEQAEQLEQLRFLEAGEIIAMAPAIADIPAGVDTPADLERVRSIFAANRPNCR